MILSLREQMVQQILAVHVLHRRARRASLLPSSRLEWKIGGRAGTCAWNELWEAYWFAACNWLGGLAYCDILARF